MEKLEHDLIQLNASQHPTFDVQIEVIFQNDKKEANLSHTSSEAAKVLAKNGTLTGALKSNVFVRSIDADIPSEVFSGLGARKDFTNEKARIAGATLFQKLSAEKIKKASLMTQGFFASLGKDEGHEALRAFLEGLLLTDYRFEKHKSNVTPNKHALEVIELVAKEASGKTALQALSHEVRVTVDCVHLCRDFSNEPSNFGTPEFYGKEIQSLGKKYGVSVKVLGEAEAKKEGMDLYLSVGQGSDREAKVVIMEYTPKKAAKTAKTIGFVGKGVTFDSGGISLKPGMRMEDMKHDMTGAATMVGATLLAARLGAPNKIVTVLVFTENMPSATAVQPGNVITSRSGKTVEIINTDAEGRLVLADALDYIQDKYKLDCLVNSATLTGACSVALGKLVSALFCNNTALKEKLLASSQWEEEGLWELPLFDEYFEDLKTPYADMKNSANDSNGGTIRGAIFMKQFIKPGTAWAHVDLANRAYDQGYLPYNPSKGSSGVYVRTFAHFAMKY